ncbi:MAG: hypothetical protein J6B81_02315 [Spirochaetaceae bacterium]|nr:hypothetical protein [Spirochaetaceae bacterium]
MSIRISEILSNSPVSFDSALNTFIPSEVIVSLIQDDCHEPLCIVKEGQAVAEGQVLATGSGIHSSVIHSPVPGVVSGFISCSMPSGKRVPAVKIKLSGEFSLFGKPKQKSNWNSYPAASIRRLISDSGVINTFSSPYPLAMQLDASTQLKNDVIVAVRLFDQDPSCVTDRFIANTYLEQVVEGAQVVATSINASAVVFFKPMDLNIEIPVDECKIKSFVLSVDTSKYPCGGQYDIIQASKKNSLGIRELNKTDLFLDSGTALAVYEAAAYNQPVVDKLIHVSGNAIAGQGMFKVRIGTSFRALAAECGGFVKLPVKIIVNGLVCGLNVSDLDTPVTKYVKSVAFLTKKTFSYNIINDCIRCGHCRNLCPVGIKPDILFSLYKKHRVSDGSFVQSAALCNGCVLCNTGCPSRLPLAQVISLLKGSRNEK